MAIDRKRELKVWQNLPQGLKREVLELRDNLIIKDGRIYTPNGSDVTHMFEVVLRTTESQARGLNAIKTLAQHEREHGGFVFAFFDARKTVEERFPELTQSDLARVMFIGTYAGWETNELRYDNGRPITKQGLRDLLGMSRNKYAEFYRKVTECGIIVEQDGNLYVSPTVFYRGHMSEVRHIAKDMHYTRLFRQTVRDLYHRYNNRSIRQLALIYAVLPFVNFAFNVVCFNPDESNPELVRPIPLDKLAALLGYQDAFKLKQALSKLKCDGKPVFGFFEMEADRRKKKIVVNPSVIYADDGKNLDAIRVLFR